MRMFPLTGFAAGAMLALMGCTSSSGTAAEEGFCFPTGPDGDDYTEADEFCLEDYCPQRDCQNRILAEAMCSRGAALDHVCICDCCDPQIEVGGDPGAPEIWEEVYTCILDAAECEQNTSVQLQLVQKGTCGETVDWYLSISPDEVWQYTGTLDGTSFNWNQIAPPSFEEEGCWEFSQDAQRFNKRSAGPGFYCVGAGSRGAGSSPATLPTCEEIEAAGIGDFTSCPQSPPANPID